MNSKLSINSAIKVFLTVGLLATAVKFGLNPKNANATSSALTGKCALLANHNMAGFESYCAANAGSCDNSVNALVLLNFDAGTYQYAATAISNPWTSTVSTSYHTAQGNFTVAADDPFTGFYKLTLDVGEEHILVPVNSGSTFLVTTKVSGQTPAQTGVCQKV
jgi:hypothetical protein